MWLIKKLWYDPSENRNAFGYETVGITKDQDLIDQLQKKTIPISDAYYPLKYVDYSNKRDVVNLYRVVEIKELKLQDMDSLNDI